MYKTAFGFSIITPERMDLRTDDSFDLIRKQYLQLMVSMPSHVHANNTIISGG